MKKTLRINELLKLFYRPSEIFTPDINLEKSHKPLMISILLAGLSNAFFSLTSLLENNITQKSISLFGNLELVTMTGKLQFLLIKMFQFGFTIYATSGFLFWVLLKIAGIKKNTFLDSASLLIFSLFPINLISVLEDTIYLFFPLIKTGSEIFSSAISFIFAFYSLVVMNKALKARYHAGGFRFYFVFVSFFVIVLSLITLLLLYFTGKLN